MPSTPATAGGSLTEGDLNRLLFVHAWPVVTELLQVAYNRADTVWLGRLSTDAVAAGPWLTRGTWTAAVIDRLQATGG